MLSSVCGTQVGKSSPRLSQYLPARGLNPASMESFDCVSPASVRAALNCCQQRSKNVPDGGVIVYQSG